MCNEANFDAMVLAAQPGQREEKKRLRELALDRGHAHRHVEHEEDDGVARLALPRAKLVEAEIVVDEGRRIGLDRPSLQRLLERQAAIEASPDTAPARALADDLRLVDSDARGRAKLGELELLGEPIDQVIHLQLELQTEAAVFVPSASFASAFVLREIAGRPQRISR